MSGLLETVTEAKYECEDGDIKALSITDLRLNALAINTQPAGAKNDNDGATRSKGKKRRGLRPRYVVFRYRKPVSIETSNGTVNTFKNVDITIPILKKDTVGQITLGAQGGTTISLYGLTFTAVKFIPEQAA